MNIIKKFIYTKGLSRTKAFKLYLYLKNHKEINYFYGYSLKGKNGERVPDDLNWLQRTNYWLLSE